MPQVPGSPEDTVKCARTQLAVSCWRNPNRISSAAPVGGPSTDAVHPGEPASGRPSAVSERYATTQEYPTLAPVHGVHLQVVAVGGVIGGRVAILSLALMTGVRP